MDYVWRTRLRNNGIESNGKFVSKLNKLRQLYCKQEGEGRMTIYKVAIHSLKGPDITVRYCSTIEKARYIAQECIDLEFIETHPDVWEHMYRRTIVRIDKISVF